MQRRAVPSGTAFSFLRHTSLIRCGMLLWGGLLGLSAGFIACSPSGTVTSSTFKETASPTDTSKGVPKDTVNDATVSDTRKSVDSGSGVVIRGRVFDVADSAPIGSVRICLSTDSSISTMTDTGGNFALKLDSSIHWAAAIWYVTCSRSGYITSGRQIKNARDTLIVLMYKKPDTTGWLPDDLVLTPGGYAYRANCIKYIGNGASYDSTGDGRYEVIADSIGYDDSGKVLPFFRGQPVPMPYMIKTSTRTLILSGDTIRVTYRDFIETKAGAVRNNIFTAMADADFNGGECGYFQVVLQVSGLPKGITVTYTDDFGGGPCGLYGTVAKIAISAETTPGNYSCAFTVSIDGKRYGEVPCAIQVLD